MKHPTFPIGLKYTNRETGESFEAEDIALNLVPVGQNTSFILGSASSENIQTPLDPDVFEANLYIGREDYLGAKLYFNDLLTSYEKELFSVGMCIDGDHRDTIVLYKKDSKTYYGTEAIEKMKLVLVGNQYTPMDKVLERTKAAHEITKDFELIEGVLDYIEKLPETKDVVRDGKIFLEGLKNLDLIKVKEKLEKLEQDSLEKTDLL